MAQTFVFGAIGALTAPRALSSVFANEPLMDIASIKPETLPTGTSKFVAQGGKGREGDRIGVDVYKPENFGPRSPTLIIIPGAGRNGDDYLNAWIDIADAQGVLAAALSYPAADYDFAAYHMGGVVTDLEFRNLLRNPDGSLPSRIYLRDEDISFTHEDEPSRWLFEDFDRIFGMLASAAGSQQTNYDLFGHSAGGQILHRYALFRPQSNADRIIAGNSGFYTLPDLDAPLLTGIKNTSVTDASLSQSFNCSLTLLLGELDNDAEKRGRRLHTPIIDRQGIGRLARGEHFYGFAQAKAQTLETVFNWRKEIVRNVGHDYRAMSRAAASVLYG